MLAIVKSGGKQYKVQAEDVIEIEKIEGDKDSVVVFQEVLFVGDENAVTIGTPFIKGAKVTGKIIEHIRTDKVTTVKHKAKKRYLKHAGHRQEKVLVKIQEISK